MRSIKVISSTLGQSSPATVSQDAEDRTNYHYRGDQKWPADRSAYVQDAQPGVAPLGLKGSSSRKQQRLEAFEAALRDLGYTPQSIPPAPPKVVREAGKQADVGYDTARVYLNELKQRSLQDGGVRDA